MTMLSQDRYHIVMLAPFGMRPKGTLAVRMLPLAQALVRRGHRVKIIAPPVHNPQDAGQREVYAGVTVIHTRTLHFSGMAGVFEQVLLLMLPIIQHKPDIVHLFKPKGYSGLAALLIRWLASHVPLVVDTDDWEGWGGWNDLLPYPHLAKHLFAWQERDLVRRAASVTVASRTLETQVWGYGVHPERVFYLPNGVSDVGLAVGTVARVRSAPCNNQSKRAVVLLYTRFWEFDVRDIVAMLVALVQQRPDVTLLVIGKGERGEHDVLMRLALQADVSRFIDYRGWVEPVHLPSLLASADVALAPMDDTLINRARCSVKVLELMASGLPIVAGRVGQVAEYIEHGKSGLLVEPSNPAALAKATLRLLDDEGLRSRLGLAAQNRATSVFTWDRVALQAERAYARAKYEDNLRQ
jgi:glycosyltransferase involved in cell wall biosynthesis